MTDCRAVESCLRPPAGRGVSYGCVLVDSTRAKVFLRKPSNGHGGYVWTFAKGMAGPGELPEQTAIREAREEYGREVRLVASLERWFAGHRWANWFWLAEDAGAAPAGFDWETEAVAWFTWDDAGSALGESRVPHRRDRDLEILAAARQLVWPAHSPVGQCGNAPRPGAGNP